MCVLQREELCHWWNEKLVVEREASIDSTKIEAELKNNTSLS